MSSSTQTGGQPPRHLNILDAMGIVVGIVIGAGIFKAPGLVASNTGGSEMMMLAWAAGGFFCLCAALSYAELACAFPRAGGEYTFLVESYGKPVGFLFVWARMTVIQTGSIAALAYIFGDYLAAVFAELGAPSAVFALAAVVALSLVNAAGIKMSKWSQNFLTAFKVAGVLAIVVAGLFADGDSGGAKVADGSGAFGLAMVFVLYTYGGWNEAAYVGGEVRQPGRNMKWVLIGSVLALTVLYLAVNAAYLKILGPEGMRSSGAVAADAMEKVAGRTGSLCVSLLVAISALGAMNGCVFTGARAVQAMGNEWPLFKPLGQWHDRFKTPVNAILAQGAMASLLVLLPFLGEGIQKAVGAGFNTAVEYTAPVFWAFLLLTGLAVFVLRKTAPDLERPFRVPLYPLTVLLFCLMSGYMLYSSLMYTKAGALVGVAVLLLGVPVYWACRQK